MEKFEKYLPLIYVIALIAVFFIIKKAIKDSSNAISGFVIGDSKETEANAKKELASLTTYPQKASFKPQTYMFLANNLFDSMKGLGTDETLMIRTFNSLKNNTDCIELVKAFGVRSGMNLRQWLQSELQAKESATDKILTGTFNALTGKHKGFSLSNLNMLMKQKGITYVFA